MLSLVRLSVGCPIHISMYCSCIKYLLYLHSKLPHLGCWYHLMPAGCKLSECTIISNAQMCSVGWYFLVRILVGSLRILKSPAGILVRRDSFRVLEDPAGFLQARSIQDPVKDPAGILQVPFRILSRILEDPQRCLERRSQVWTASRLASLLPGCPMRIL